MQSLLASRRFIGRHKELKCLKKIIESPFLEFVPIYGRRRVGKTTLLRRLLVRKDVVYFQAVSNGELLNLELLNKVIFSTFNNFWPEVSTFCKVEMNGPRLIKTRDTVQ